MAVLIKDAPLPSSACTSLLLPLHSSFIEKFGSDKSDYEYVVSEFLRINGVYWSLTAMDIMGRRDNLDQGEILSFVRSCHCPTSGGYSPSPNHDPHILYTLSAVQIAATYDALDVVDADGIVRYIRSLQLPDGSFTGDKWGEVDTRFSFCAVATLALLGRLGEVDVDKAVEFVVGCMNFDGGFGSKNGSESHAGLIYCCVAFLSVTHRLDAIDADLLGWWLCERQLPSGGLNGRPEKLPDVCYSWWVLASLSIMGRLHWIDADKLSGFILAAQDDDAGGIADRPGDMADPFHTLFGLAGLSMLKARENCKGLKEVNPVFCMAEEVIQRMGVKHEMIKK